MASSGSCDPALPGEICPSGTETGRPSTTDSAAGLKMERWNGTLEEIARHLQGELDAEGRIDWEQFNVDSTVVQAARAAAGGPNDDKKGTEPAERTPV